MLSYTSAVIMGALPRKQHWTATSTVNEDNPSSPPQPPVRSSIGTSLIPTINKLHDILSPLNSDVVADISLPYVAVVGSQSSGKSSVLEALVGRDFLPRSFNICTRRPLILQLQRQRQRRPPCIADDDNDTDTDNNIESDDYGDHDCDGDDREWGEFLHLPNIKFYDFSAIRREIEAETEREAGKDKGVSDKPIRLKIFSKNVVDITLIDLPGITKVPVGDQPTDIEARIRKMIMSHIRQENCIILAVSPANSDLATSDALQMSKLADPNGTRTIGVITKLDIMDRGTDACDFLKGKVIPLHLGYIGVINRSQEDINKNKCVAEALSFEEQFFRDHPEYHCVKDRCGIPQLAKKLNQILEQHIRATLPALKSQIKSYFRAVKEELRTYSDGLESKEKRGSIVLNILRSYSEGFSSVIDGKNPEMSTKELTGGARIRYIFHSIYGKALKEIDPCERLSDDEIRIAIQNSMGPRNKLFVPEVPFELLIKGHVKRLLDPSMQCLQFVCDELIKMSQSCESAELQKFPAFRKRVEGVISDFVYNAIKPAEKRIAETIEMEADDINTSHPNFVGGQKAIQIARQIVASKGTAVDVDHLPFPKRDQKSANQGGQKPEKCDRSASADALSKLFGMPSKIWSRSSSNNTSTCMNGEDMSNHTFETSSSIQLEAPSSSLRPSEEPTEDEETEILATRILLKSYFDVVRKKIEDDIPKAIMHFVVNHLKRDLHNTLIQTIYKEELFEELLQESSDVMKKRKHAHEMFNVLQKAVQTLDEIESELSAQRGPKLLENIAIRT